MILFYFLFKFSMFNLSKKYLNKFVQKFICYIGYMNCLDSSVWWSARLVISWSRVQFPFGALISYFLSMFLNINILHVKFDTFIY